MLDVATTESVEEVRLTRQEAHGLRPLPQGRLLLQYKKSPGNHSIHLDFTTSRAIYYPSAFQPWHRVTQHGNFRRWDNSLPLLLANPARHESGLSRLIAGGRGGGSCDKRVGSGETLLPKDHACVPVSGRFGWSGTCTANDFQMLSAISPHLHHEFFHVNQETDFHGTGTTQPPSCSGGAVLCSLPHSSRPLWCSRNPNPRRPTSQAQPWNRRRTEVVPPFRCCAPKHSESGEASSPR